ncbi:uncharacterized protein MELLADRAFT_110956 [Melampsora larici-populina 98AG31]|uniref:Uncharacterized protein n=1 Tax=Melampsora larici-populina (strain 98AG31 / pathotype 3-4-7) TaxID=747676 RepID=F4S1K0_MELLP|nr:uncharacterized protein MELLADRAFT_110956 [Melampsora larici-populina 98AG31]EGG01492.1 hypothetical protein MELLADRAFT_110956 [Melampsora larici-populina 98AG31]
MIVGFMLIIYVSIQNQKLDETLTKILQITQRTDRLLNSNQVLTSARSPTATDRHPPASYPSVLTQELNSPNLVLQNFYRSSNLDAAQSRSHSTNRAHSSASFPFVKKHPKSHRFSLSHSPNVSRMSHYPKSFQPDRSSHSKDQEHIVDIPDNPSENILRDSPSTRDRPGSLPAVPERSRLSSLIRQSHPHIILAHASDPVLSTRP